MRFGRDTRSRNPYLAIFDIGATSVGVGIAHNAKGVTTVLWSSRTEYSYQAYDEYARYERAMYSTLFEAGMKLMSEGVRAVHQAHGDFSVEQMRVVCVLEAPWFWGAVGRAEMTKEKSFAVTPDLIKGLHEQAYQEVLTVSEGRSWRDVVGEAVLLENHPQRLEINGYAVTTYEHEQANSVAISIYFACVGSAVRAQVEQILGRVVPNHTVRLTTSTSLLATYYRTTVGTGTGHRLFLLEVEGRITSITSVEGGTIVRVSTLPLGTNHILRAAAPDALSTEEARGKLLVAFKNQETNTTPLPEAVVTACETWREAVLGEFVRHGAGAVPPERVLLMAGARWIAILTPLLERPWLMPGIRKERSLTVTPFLELIAQPKSAESAPPPKEEGTSRDSRIRLFTHALFYSPPE